MLDIETKCYLKELEHILEHMLEGTLLYFKDVQVPWFNKTDFGTLNMFYH